MIIPPAVIGPLARFLWWLWGAMVVGPNAPHVARVTVFATLAVSAIGLWRVEGRLETLETVTTRTLPAMVAARNAELAAVRQRDEVQDAVARAHGEAISALAADIRELTRSTSMLAGQVTILSREVFARLERTPEVERP